MMRSVGSGSFGIEFELTPRDGKPELDDRLNGHLRFIVGGSPVGDGSREVSLNAGTVAVGELLLNRGRRGNSELMAATADVIFQTAFGALYVDSGQSDEQVERDWSIYSSFLGVPKGFESFDGWQAFLIEDDDRARYVWRQTEDPSYPIREHSLRPGEFDGVLAQFLLEMRLIAPTIVSRRGRGYYGDVGRIERRDPRPGRGSNQPSPSISAKRRD